MSKQRRVPKTRSSCGFPSCLDDHPPFLIPFRAILKEVSSITDPDLDIEDTKFKEPQIYTANNLKWKNAFTIHSQDIA